MLTQVMRATADKHTKQLQYDKARKQKVAYQKRRRSARYPVTDKSSQYHYGSSAQQPDISPTELSTLCTEYFTREIMVSCDEAEQIERDTRGQSESSLWYHHRRIKVTASNFGMIHVAKRKATTPVANAVKTFLYTRSANTKAMR